MDNKLFTLLLTFTIFIFTSCTVKGYKRFDQNQDLNQTFSHISDTQYEEEQHFEWKISKGDRVEIHAYTQSSGSTPGQLGQLLNTGGEITGTQSGDAGLLIGNDGTVRLPLLGAVKIIGLTEDQASVKITNQYKKYLKNPYIILKVLNQKVFILGEVNTPGVVQITHGTMSLVEALALSGDVTEYADRTKIKIIRGDMRHPTIQEIDLTDFNKLAYSNLILQPNDLLYVASRDSKVSAAGYAEAMPFWNLMSTILTPISAAFALQAVIQQ